MSECYKKNAKAGRGRKAVAFVWWRDFPHTDANGAAASESFVFRTWVRALHRSHRAAVGNPVLPTVVLEN